jgi:hypothetical protein
MTIGKFSFDVAELNRFDINAIPAIADDELLAVRISNWCSSEVRQYVVKQLEGETGVPYGVEAGFQKLVGGAIYDVEGKPELLKHYLDNAPNWFAMCRKIFGPYLSPFEKLWLELQQQWPHGCRLQLFNGRPAFAGLLRGVPDGGKADIHQDMTRWDIRHVAEARDLGTVLSCVTYIDCADAGGLLELWKHGFTDETEYNRCKVPNEYGIDRRFVGDPAAILTPRPGDLIMFNAQKLHAVTRTQSDRRRLTQSAFVAYRGPTRELSTYC